MKRIRKDLLILFVLLIGISFNVKAERFDYYITNSNNYEQINNNETKSIKRGDTITVTAILFNHDNVINYKISSGKLTIRWNEKFFSLVDANGKYYNDSLSDITGLTIGNVNKSSNKLTLNDISSTGNIKAGINKIVEFKFTALKDANASEAKIYQMDGEDNLKCLKGEETTAINCGDSLLSELKYSIIKSEVNKLSSIKINGHELEYFNENTNEYDINVDGNNSSIKIEAIKKDNYSTISGDLGEKQLDYGGNKFTITVTSESGIKNNYIINVNRIDKRSNVNTLKTLTLSEGELVFNPDIVDYTVNVANDIEKITITSSLTDPKSKYAVDYQNKEIELAEGSNKIEIKVISEKGEERTYTLNINRALSSNNSLKSLKVNDEKINLLENEFIYNITVENDIDEVIITAIPNDSRATVKLDEKYPLIIGENEINVKITAASGEEASYILNITRKKILSKDSLLVNLKIKGYEIDFRQDVKRYNLKINDGDNELDITTVTEDPNATVEIEGNKDLENGSIVKINVKAEDGSFTRYFINIEKGSTGISPIIIIIIVLLLLLGGCIGLIIYRKTKKEVANFDKLDDNKTDNNNPDEENMQVEVAASDENSVETDVDSNIDTTKLETYEQENLESNVEKQLEEENYAAHSEDYVGMHEEAKDEAVESKEKDVS